MDTEKIKAEGLCCISGKPLSTSNFLNVIDLNVKAKWPFPVSGNILTGECNMAVAIVHDDCIIDGKPQGEILHAMEFKDNEIIYHPLTELQ